MFQQSFLFINIFFIILGIQPNPQYIYLISLYIINIEP